jgi:hypothetical protein
MLNSVRTRMNRKGRIILGVNLENGEDVCMVTIQHDSNKAPRSNMLFFHNEGPIFGVILPWGYIGIPHISSE